MSPTGVGLAFRFNGADGSDRITQRSAVDLTEGTHLGVVLGVGTTLVGSKGLAAATATNWTSVSFSNLVGAAAVVPYGQPDPVTTGPGSATISYTATVGGRTYVVDRMITYSTDDPSTWREDYAVTIPPGNSSLVRLFVGGDVHPGATGADASVGMTASIPRRQVFEVDPSGLEMGYAEVPGTAPFTSFVAGPTSAWYPPMQSGGSTLSGTVGTIAHDAGLGVQWNVGVNAGTYPVAVQGWARASAIWATGRWTTDTGTVGSPVTYELTTTNAGGTGLGYTLGFDPGQGLEPAAFASSGACASATILSPTYHEDSGFAAGRSVCSRLIDFTPTRSGRLTVGLGSALTRTAQTVSVGDLSSTVTVSGPAWFADTTLATATQGSAYSDGVAAGGYPDTFTYSVTAGSLPPGVTMNPATGAIAGTPTLAGSYGFTVMASNGIGPDPTADLTLTVDPTSGGGSGGGGSGGGGGGGGGGAIGGSDAGFLGLAPIRLIDTRDPGGTALAAGETRQVAVFSGPSVGEVPTDTSAVVVNVAVDQPTTDGFLTVFPCGTPKPTAANLNFVAGQTASNSATSVLGTGGKVCVFSSAPTQLVVDLDGAYSVSAGQGRLTGVAPVRRYDSRNGDGRRQSGSMTVVPIRGTGVPGDATSAVLNIAVDGPTAPGFLTVYPCDAARPTAANLNFAAGETTSNAVAAKLAGNGSVCVFTSAPTDLVVDVSSAYAPSTTGGHLLQTGVSRLFDSRDVGPRPAAGSVHVIPVAGSHGVPTSATAAVLNLAVDQPALAGFATVYPCGQDAPFVANLNYRAGQTKSNSVTVGLGTGGAVCVYTLTGTHVIVDVDAAFGP